MIVTAGLGFKAQHLDEALACRAAGLWFEVHAENYMVDGGPRLAAPAIGEDDVDQPPSIVNRVCGCVASAAYS